MTADVFWNQVFRWLVPILLSIISLLLTLIWKVLENEGRALLGRIVSIETTQKRFIAGMLVLTAQLHPEKASAIIEAFSEFVREEPHGKST